MPDPNAPKQERDLVYISYSHKDKEWHKQLREILDRNERIKARVWDDTKIPPGSDFRKEINTHAARAKVMIMLVSPDYLAPKCGARDCETLPAVEAAQRGELTILWVAVRESDYEHSPIGHLMAAFPPSPPLEEMKTLADQHAAWRSLCDQVLKVLGLGSHGFDVFLSHNSKDKPAVRQLAQALQQRGLKVWLDEWELTPGRPWMPMLEEILRDTRTAAVLFGPAGLGPWEEPEMRVALDQFVKRSLPVIPVLLPGASKEPELPLFLQQFGWVDLRDGLTKEGLDRLEWGITGRKPSP